MTKGRLKPSLVVTAMAVAGLLAVRPVQAEELEPKAYSAAPVGTNFLVLGYSNSVGTVGVDASLPIRDIRADLDVGTIGFSHTFDLGGHMASWALQAPYAHIDATGQVHEASRHVSRSGLANLRARVAVNLIGCPALRPAAFAQRKPATVFGASLTVLAPVGTYNPAYLVNTSTNRWSLKPEIGIEEPLSRWFLDASAGYWFFTTNTNYLGGQTLKQNPLSDLQFHGGYNFRQGAWVAMDANYYAGGATSLNGAPALNRLGNSRYGLTSAIPFGHGFSTKLAWSHWLNGRYGQNFNTIAIALQYRWFDGS